MRGCEACGLDRLDKDAIAGWSQLLPSRVYVAERTFVVGTWQSSQDLRLAVRFGLVGTQANDRTGTGLRPGSVADATHLEPAAQWPEYNIY